MSDATIGGSSDRFGYEWATYATILPEQFRRWLPFFSPDDWRGKRFIDVGWWNGPQQFLAHDLWRNRRGGRRCR
jgi:hypothetical protein